ncbi:sigma-70 family RNA polymerase sigma factor [Aquisphaera insulae]|uniref:sigma-70 family RNA polymerase sigma factor n=1 Tax=Aquisphaera insulae TaxID=2712864 RepID=UPI0013ECF38C|nr:sigma-70 family RNA polymerase sigma factor [Aquisphaera insulae]
MKQATPSPVQPPAHFRDYLHLLARRTLDPRLRTLLDPSDLVQQTLVTAIEKIDQFRGRTNAEMAGWLRMILANQLARATRRHINHPAGRLNSLEAQLARSSGRLELLLAGNDPSPGSAVARAELAVKLAAAIARLPEDQRTAIELRHLEALPVAGVAEKMGRSIPAVAGLLFRAARQLREIIDARGEDRRGGG